MSTTKQHEANQRNAQFSTGPKTQEGKDKVRLNPIKHGLRTKIIEVLPTEDRPEFVRRRESLFNDYAPRTEIEIHLVDQAALLIWKIDRANRHEIAQLSNQVINNARSCLSDPKIPYSHMNEAFVNAGDLASFDASNDGERLRRYQFSLQNALFRTLDRLGKPRNLDAQDGDDDVAAPPVEAESAIPVAQCDNVAGQVADTPHSPVQAPSSPVQAPPTPEQSAPSKPNSPADRQESRPQNRPSKPNLPGRVKLSSMFDKPRTIINPPNIAPSKAGDPGWLDISIDPR